MLLVHPDHDPAVADSPPSHRDGLREVLGGLLLHRVDAVALALLAAAAVVGVALLWVLARPGAAPGAGAAPTGGAAFELASPPASTGPSPGPTELTVHVAGLVVAPGVQRLPAGARVGDAVDAAGGAAAGAVLDGVNLARPLVDGEQVLVGGAGAPAAGTGGARGAGTPAPGGAVRPDGLLDLNLATVDDLDELPGVGPVLAERILTHREEIGRFSEVGELRDVSGIGEKTFQDLAPLVVV